MGGAMWTGALWVVGMASMSCKLMVVLATR